MASFDFFRKHQKVILYSAGLFALLTFSVTGAMTAFIDDMFRPPFRGATMTLADGRRIFTTADDQHIGQALSQTPLYPDLIPPLGDAKSGPTERADILAAVRRLAIEHGLEASDDEVEKAVAAIAKVWPPIEGAGQVTLADFARSAGRSPGEYARLMRESLRISTFLRLCAFSADASDAQIAESVVRGLKMLTLRVATLDKKAIEETLKATEVTDDQLREWLGGLSDIEKVPFQDTNRVALRLAGLKLAEFDPAAFAKELAGKEYGEAAISDRYNLDREVLFRREKKEGEDPPPDPYIPLAEVKDQIVKRLQAEDVLRAVLDNLRDALAVQLQPLVDVRTEKSKELAQLRQKQVEADKATAEKPDDTALKDAATAAKAATEAAEQAVKDADAAVDAARKSFDMLAALPQATTGTLVTANVPETKNADELKELAEFGTWEASWSAPSVELVGDFGPRVQNTKTSAFLFQVSDVVKSPLKEFDKIRDQLREAYYKAKADTQAKEMQTKFEAALERLARVAKQTEIDAAEAEHQAELQKKFDEWKTTQEASLERARKMRQSLEKDPLSIVYQQWQAKFETVEKALADPEAHRKTIEAELRKETDDKIKKLVRAAHKDVLAVAAAEAGLTVETVGPFRKDLDRQPRFQDSFPPRVRFLFGNAAVKDLAVGAASDVLEDFTNRAHYVAVMEKIEPGTLADITRRDILSARESYVGQARAGAVTQSFSLDALREGWGYARADGDSDVAAAQKKAEPEKPDSKPTDPK